MIRFALCCAALFAFAASAPAAEKAAPAKRAAKPAPKPAAKAPKAQLKPPSQSSAKLKPPVKGVVKTSFRPAPPKSPVLRGPTEVLTCRDGTEDRHARIAVVLVGGRADSFAYYSKWKPRTCSIYLQRNRDFSKWADNGSVTNVSTERGVFLIEHGKGRYRFVFRDVDRERYCGMDGVMNGTLTLRKGSEHCEVAGIMEEGVLLGQAVAHMEQQAAAAVAEAAPAAPAPARKQMAQRRREPDSPFPAPTVGLSD